MSKTILALESKPNAAMKQFLFLVATSILVCLHLSCNKRPLKVDFENAAGYVIGKETCNSDDSENYWLLDFTVYPNTPKIGDSLILNGNIYTNVLKVKGLDPQLKQIGKRVSIDYREISANKVTTTNCNASSPITYNLKELFIINQGEIR